VTLPCLHIWVNAQTQVIARVLHDQGDPKAMQRVERINHEQGFTALHRIVICDGIIKVVPPTGEG
jgi:hypothetical protein